MKNDEQKYGELARNVEAVIQEAGLPVCAALVTVIDGKTFAKMVGDSKPIDDAGLTIRILNAEQNAAISKDSIA